MSEQSKIIAQMQALIMDILKTGTTSIEQANQMDALEEALFQQNAFEEIDDPKHSYRGEEIASLFFTNNYEKAIEKMYRHTIIPEDFFGFVHYYYDEDHEDENLTTMFTNDFIAKVAHDYLLQEKQ